MSRPTRSSELVPLDLATYVRFHGEHPPYRVRGVAVIVDGEPVAVGGIGFHGGWLEVFMDMRPEATNYPKLLLKGGKQVVQMGEEYGLPMYAVRNEELDTAPRFLSHLGFTQDGELWSL